MQKDVLISVSEQTEKASILLWWILIFIYISEKEKRN